MARTNDTSGEGHPLSDGRRTAYELCYRGDLRAQVRRLHKGVRGRRSCASSGKARTWGGQKGPGRGWRVAADQKRFLIAAPGSFIWAPAFSLLNRNFIRP